MRRHGQQHEEPDDDDDDVPLHHKRGFGAGLKRKRVEFVRATDPDLDQIKPVKASNGVDVGDLYASIVFGKSNTASASASSSTTATTTEAAARNGSDAVPHSPKPGENAQEGATPQAPTGDAAPICTICSLPITTTLREHSATLAHQVSLAHSHPPSALDRSRMGLRTLAAQGWDPDARQGLGREGEGLRFPIKTVAKEDTLGIGAVAPDPEAAAAAKRERESERPKPMTAKERKALEKKEKERAARLQAEIFGSVDVERYLRGGGGDA